MHILSRFGCAIALIVALDHANTVLGVSSSSDTCAANEELIYDTGVVFSSYLALHINISSNSDKTLWKNCVLL